MTIALSSRRNLTVPPWPPSRRALAPDTAARNAIGVILNAHSLGGGRLTRTTALIARALPAALLAVT